MSFARMAAVVVSGSVLCCTAASAGGPLRPFKHGYWSGGAYVDDRTGAFTHCSAGVAYDSGINLFVLLTVGYRWWLGLINPNWQFTPNTRAAIKLALDDGTPFDGRASIPNGQLLLISLPDSSKLLAAFRRGSKLALDAEGQTYSFKLNGTPAVMDELASCVRTSLVLAARMPATAPSLAAAPAIGTKAAGDATPPSGPPAAASQAAAEAAPAATALPATPRAPRSPAPGSPQWAAGSRPPAPPLSQRGAAAPPLVSRSNGPAAPARLAGGASSVGATAGTPGSAAPATAGFPPAPATASAPQTAAATASPAAPGAEQTGEPATHPISTAAPQLAPSAAETQETAAPSGLSGSATPPDSTTPPPLAFTSAPPPPSAVAVPQLPPAALSTTALEEVRLATDFVTRANLADARLVVADKPPALADFNAVWRSEGGAGAVKIIPPGRDVSGIRIASDLIAVDPQLCKGDFSAARFRSDVDNRVVFNAVLSCSEAKEDRVTEYFIAPRHQGGFVVFAVIRRTAAGARPGFDWHKIDVLSRAAIEAAESQG